MIMNGKKSKKPYFNQQLCFDVFLSDIFSVYTVTKYQPCSSLSLYKIKETGLLINNRVLLQSSEGWNVQDHRADRVSI